MIKTYIQTGILFLLPLAAFAAGPAEDTASPDLTPDLSSANNMWTKTSPQTQVVLGIGEVLALVPVNLLHNPEYRRVAKEYKTQTSREEKVQQKYDSAKSRLSAEELNFRDLETSKNSAHATFESEVKLITVRTHELEKAKKLLTATERDSKLRALRSRYVELNSRAIAGHTGAITDHNDLFEGLPSDEKAEALRFKQEYNEVVAMPSLTETERDKLVETSLENLRSATQARDLALKNIHNFDAQLAAKASEVEKLKPTFAATETELLAEKQLTSEARDIMDVVGKRFGARILAFKVLRWGGNAYIAADLGTRVGYYFYGRKDPGWFPFAHFVRSWIP